MRQSRNTRQSSVVCEALEPRLLLSAAPLTAIESLDFGDVPEYISMELLPEYEQQDDTVISPNLRQTQQTIAALLAETPTADLSQLSSSDVRVAQNGALHVYVHIDQVNDSIVQSLQGAGLSVENTNAGMGVVQGWLDQSLLDSLVAIEGVRHITPPGYAITNAGDITSAGDGILNADDLRSTMNVTGDGVKIGVIANGLDHWDNVDDSGNLPTYSSGITVHSTFSGKGDEGTAMLEIIYDLAPDAGLYFAGYRSNGTFSSADMTTAIDWMVAQGVDVIVDDLGFFDQPIFEDGTIAETVADAVSSGVVYVTTAGNTAQTHYQGDYNAQGGGSSYHLFHDNPNDTLLRVDVPTDGNVEGMLQWSDQWGSSGNDYDLELWAWNGSTWIQVEENEGNDVQDGDDNPYESRISHIRLAHLRLI